MQSIFVDEFSQSTLHKMKSLWENYGVMWRKGLSGPLYALPQTVYVYCVFISIYHFFDSYIRMVLAVAPGRFKTSEIRIGNRKLTNIAFLVENHLSIYFICLAELEARAWKSIANTYIYIHSTVDRNTVHGIVPLPRIKHSAWNSTFTPEKIATRTCTQSTNLGIAPHHHGDTP